DECCDSGDSGGHDDRETATPRLDDLHEDADRLPPANGGSGLGHRVRGRLTGSLDSIVVFVLSRCEVVVGKGKFVLTVFGLPSHQPAIWAVASDQFGMATALDDMAVVED